MLVQESHNVITTLCIPMNHRPSASDLPVGACNEFLAYRHHKKHKLSTHIVISCYFLQLLFSCILQEATLTHTK